VVLKMKNAADICETSENVVFCMYPLCQRGTNCVKLEASIYSKKVYVFLKPYFMPKANKTLEEPPLDTILEADEVLTRDPELEAFLLNFEDRKQAEATPKWLPRQGALQLTTDDIVLLQKFINAQYAV